MSSVYRGAGCLSVPVGHVGSRTSLASTGYEVRLNERVIIKLNHASIFGYPWYTVLTNKA